MKEKEWNGMKQNKDFILLFEYFMMEEKQVWNIVNMMEENNFGT